MARLYDMMMKSEAKPILAQKPIDKPKTQAMPEVTLKAIGKPIRGRPRIEDKGKTLTALKPWEALGMSRRTWERRRKEPQDNAKQ